MARAGHHELTGAPGARRGAGVALVAAIVMIIAGAGLTVWAWLEHTPGSAGAPIAANLIRPDPLAPSVRIVPPAGFSDQMKEQSGLVAAVVADVTQFWAEKLPPLSRQPFEPLRGGVTAIDSAAESGSAPCVGTPSGITGNAFYCPGDDGIVYDAAALVPVLLHRYGVGGLISTFAHEFGHAVAPRLEAASSGSGAASGASTPLAGEARADCDAGAFLAWAVAGHAPHLAIDDDALMGAIGPLVDFADQTTVSPDDPTAHGLAVDRLTWFTVGYRQGPAACGQLSIAGATLGAVSPGKAGSEGAGATMRYANRAALLAAAERSIVAFLGQPIAAAGSPALLDKAAAYGQFAQATVLAIAIGSERGFGPVAAACFAGAWVRSIYGSAGSGELGSWPGDANEGLYAVLGEPAASFATATAYLDGFHEGLTACR